LRLQFAPRRFQLTAAPGWAQRYPQSAWLLQEEAQAWAKVGVTLALDLRA
jgi:exopolyphosphatase/guanosine-5'-triphosphate,3'-diphosphate pyrophosphatase